MGRPIPGQDNPVDGESLDADGMMQNFAVTGPPASSEELSDFLDQLRAEKIEDPFIPVVLSQLWSRSREWHLIKDHYQSFGLNFWKPDEVIPSTLMVFGDEDNHRGWMELFPSPNCAELGWVCFGSFSEFDYLYINVDHTNPSWGHVRRMVNNSPEEELFSGSPEQFLEAVAQFASTHAQLLAEEGPDSEELEELQFRDFFRRAR